MSILGLVQVIRLPLKVVMLSAPAFSMSPEFHVGNGERLGCHLRLPPFKPPPPTEVEALLAIALFMGTSWSFMLWQVLVS
jgi:hypothetical protein